MVGALQSANLFPKAVFLLLSVTSLPVGFAVETAKPIAVKVVVLTMFEQGKDTGDVPGELQLWAEKGGFSQTMPFPAGYHDILATPDGVIATVTGMGTARAAASVMALGLDPRFDFSKTYWLVAGIAGIDPADGSIGSAAWAEWVIDGDLSYQIDSREAPKEWSTGYIPLRHDVPYQKPVIKGEGESYHLNPKLVAWAYELTKAVPLNEDDKMKANRQRYLGYPKAQGSPVVMKGDTLSGSTFWHGKLLDRWANDWVSYWSEGKGNFVTTAMEDTGTLQSLTFLAKTGRVDLDRVLVLRTASNFDMPPPGMTAAASLAEENGGSYSAYRPSLEAAFAVGNTVVRKIVSGWDQKYRDQTPGK